MEKTLGTFRKFERACSDFWFSFTTKMLCQTAHKYNKDNIRYFDNTSVKFASIAEKDWDRSDLVTSSKSKKRIN